jgi:hypothetical protein
MGVGNDETEYDILLEQLLKVAIRILVKSILDHV